MVGELYLNNFRNVNHRFSQGDYLRFSSPPFPTPFPFLSSPVPSPWLPEGAFS